MVSDAMKEMILIPLATIGKELFDFPHFQTYVKVPPEGATDHLVRNNTDFF